MQKQGGSKKLCRSGKDRTYYVRQRSKTNANKFRRAHKRLKRKAFWVARGFKKDGVSRVREWFSACPVQ